MQYYTTRFNIETPIFKTNYLVWESMHAWILIYAVDYISAISLAITDALRPVFTNYSISFISIKSRLTIIIACTKTT